jgi:hypothetical protein
VRISDQDYQHGLQQLEQLSRTHDPEGLLSSEVPILEFWGQKIMQERPDQQKRGQDE